MLPKGTIALEDKETIINCSEYHIGKWAEVYTTDRVVMRRFENFCTKHSEYGRIIREDDCSMTFSVHPKCASLYPRAPRKMNMSDERKQMLRDRLNEVRNKK